MLPSVWVSEKATRSIFFYHTVFLFRATFCFASPLSLCPLLAKWRHHLAQNGPVFMKVSLTNRQAGRAWVAAFILHSACLHRDPHQIHGLNKSQLGGDIYNPPTGHKALQNACACARKNTCPRAKMTFRGAVCSLQTARAGKGKGAFSLTPLLYSARLHKMIYL